MSFEMSPSVEMLNGIILSIKPKYNELILSKEKKFEFRNFQPKNSTSYFWVYESKPTKSLRYVMEVAQPIVFPNSIKGSSYGVERFNSGEMNRRFAYEIVNIYILEKPIEMDYLKNNFKFVPPQQYTYLNRNRDMMVYLENNVKLIKH